MQMHDPCAPPSVGSVTDAVLAAILYLTSLPFTQGDPCSDNKSRLFPGKQVMNWNSFLNKDAIIVPLYE